MSKLAVNGVMTTYATESYIRRGEEVKQDILCSYYWNVIKLREDYIKKIGDHYVVVKPFFVPFNRNGEGVNDKAGK